VLLFGLSRCCAGAPQAGGDADDKGGGDDAQGQRDRKLSDRRLGQDELESGEGQQKCQPVVQVHEAGEHAGQAEVESPQPQDGEGVRCPQQRSFTLTRYGGLFEDGSEAAVDRLDALLGSGSKTSANPPPRRAGDFSDSETAPRD
jgi:hypothetical protein